MKTAAKSSASSSQPATARSVRITSIDALRGFVMFMMICVNDLAGAGKIVPDWMVHFSDRHHGGSGMTLVDLVFPAFLFIVGDFWLAHYVGIGETLGSLAAITVGGLLLATILVATDTVPARARIRFTLLFIAGTAASAWLLHGLYGINKNNATPSWCLWACAITAALWLGFYLVSEVWFVGFLAKPLAVAGQNVLLAYLLSEMIPSTLSLLNLGGWYGRLATSDLWHAVVRSAGCGIVIICLTAGLNRFGFRLKL